MANSPDCRSTTDNGQLTTDTLKLNLQCQLNIAVVSDRGCYLAHGPGADSGIGKTELRMVEEIESIRAQLYLPSLVDGNVFDQRRIEVHLPGRIQNAATYIAVRVRRRRHKIGRIEPQIHGRMFLGSLASTIWPAGRAVINPGCEIYI